MAKSRSRASREKDKLRRRQQRQQISETFKYCPVDDTWKTEKNDELHLPPSNISATSFQAIALMPPAQTLMPPVALRKIKPDGNCFFRCLSFVLTGNEEHYDLLRQTICNYMRMHTDRIQTILPNTALDVVSYLTTSEMHLDRTWASEVEIHAASILLKTNIYVYTQHGVHWTWIRYTSEFNSSDKGIYLYHKNQNHFDVVMTVDNSFVCDDLRRNELFYTFEDNNLKRKAWKNSHEQLRYSLDENYKQEKKTSSRQRYENDPRFSENKRTKTNINYNSDPMLRKRKLDYYSEYQKKRYKIDSDFKDKRQKASRHSQSTKYAKDPHFKVNKKKVSKEYQRKRYRVDNNFKCKKQHFSKLKQKQKYATNDAFASYKRHLSFLKYTSYASFRNRMKQLSLKKYATDEKFRKNTKQYSKDKYSTDEKFRNKTKQYSKDKYSTDEKFRNKTKQYFKDKYSTDEKFRNKTKQYSKDKYSTDEKFRNNTKQYSKDKYSTDEKFRNNTKQYSKDKYSTDEKFRNNTKQYSKDKYSTDEKFRNNTKLYSKEKYSTDEKFRNNTKLYSKEKYSTDEKFRNKTKQYSKTKYASDHNFRNKVRLYSKSKYRTFTSFRNHVKASSIKKYATSPLFKSRLKGFLKTKYHNSKIIQETKKARVRQSRKSLIRSIEKFRTDIKDTPKYVCTVCIRILYKSQVKICKRERYSNDGTLNENAKECLTGSYVHNCKDNRCTNNCVLKILERDKEWICHNCDRYLKQQKMPPQSLKNNLHLPPIPEELAKLNELERQLIALRIPFAKLLSLPRGGQKGVKGPVVNVPSDLNTITTTLPRNFDDAQLIKVKLKRKLAYKGHYNYKWINPTNVLTALMILLEHNIWYDNIALDTSWSNDIQNSELVPSESIESDSDSDEESEEKTNDIPVESCFQPIDIGQEILDTNKILCLAPAENQTPENIFKEQGSDAMAFPVLLPTGHFGLFEERKIKLSPAKYFNARLFSADTRFAQDKQFIFFAQYVTELNYISSNISLALRKGNPLTEDGQKVTASMVTNSDNLNEILKTDTGYRFLQPVRGTPPYWQRTMKDLFAMIRQLGIPTWFVTFSAAEMRWDEVIQTLLQLNNDSRPVSELEWADRSKLVADNPVICARMFDHRVKALFSDLIMSPSHPVGNVIDYFYRTEFQQRGSPHIHCLLWVKDSPKFNEDTDEEVCHFIDKYITSSMPSKETDPELFEIISTVQIHSKNHSKSCQKYSSTCRFNFPRPPIRKTFIARSESETKEDNLLNSKAPTAAELDEISKSVSRSPKQILRDIWILISTSDQTNLSFSKILQLANVDYPQFKKSLKDIATRNTVHIKRQLSDIWINNYNEHLSRAWSANLDIQYVTDSYACVAYILSYISKAETEMGDLLKNAKEEADEGNIDASAAMRKIGNVYLQNREVSAQEAIYRVCSLHLKQCSRDVIFIPAGKNITKMSLPISIIQARAKQGGGDNENIWMTSIYDKYYARPDTEHFRNMSLAEFCSKHRILSNSQKPKSTSNKKTLPVYQLQKDLGFIQQRKTGKEAVIRFPKFNINKNPDEYFLSLLQLYLPHRSQITLPSEAKDYEDFVRSGHLDGTPILSIIEEKKHQFEIDAETLDKAWEDLQQGKIHDESWANIAPEAEVERIEIEMEKEPDIIDEQEDIPELNYDANQTIESKHSFDYQAPKIPEKIIQESLRNMNSTQQQVFYNIRDWCFQVLRKQQPTPFHVFLTGGAGTGKSHLIKCIYHEATRILSKCSTSPDSISVLLTAPTGTAAFNIQGLTIHSAFVINKNIRLPYQPLGENILNSLRNKFDSLQILIIDEISMVDQKILSYIHGRLAQIKHSKKPFGNISILAVGDFHQLPPVRGLALYKHRESDFMDLWNTNFTIATLTEIMRQKDDKFAAMLNRIRTHIRGNPLESKDKDALLSVCHKATPENVADVLHIYPTNKEVDKHNQEMIAKKCNPIFTSVAQDFYRDVVTGKVCQREHPFVKSSSDDLLMSIRIGVGARVMLTRNIDTEDGLVNGAFGTITSIDHSPNKQSFSVYIKFDNPKIGQKHLKKTVADKSKRGSIKVQAIDEILRGKQVTRKQLPFKLGWAATIHKVQGMTTSDIVVSMNKIFQPGMAYVALSRTTSLSGLHILNFNPDTIYSSEDIIEALQKMPPFLTSNPVLPIDKPAGMLTIIHHNTEGILPHLKDINCLKQITNCDVVCFTETWLQKHATTPKTFLPAFSSYLLARSDAFNTSQPAFNKLKSMERGGVAIFPRTAIQHTYYPIQTDNLEAVAIIVHQPVKLLLVTIYRSQSYPMEIFCTKLLQLFEEIHQLNIPSVVLGDFNENVFLATNLKDKFSEYGYTQIVTKPTTESGSCIDLVFVKGLSSTVNITIVPTYYSFHDAVHLSIKIPLSD